MTDLIKRDDALAAIYEDSPEWTREAIAALPAIDPADTVKDLMKLRDYWMKDSAAAWDECEVRRLEAEAAEAKLTKAVETLQILKPLLGDSWVDRRVLAVLAELEK